MRQQLPKTSGNNQEFPLGLQEVSGNIQSPLDRLRCHFPPSSFECLHLSSIEPEYGIGMLLMIHVYCIRSNACCSLINYDLGGVIHGFCCVWTSCLVVRVALASRPPLLLHTDRQIDPPARA